MDVMALIVGAAAHWAARPVPVSTSGTPATSCLDLPVTPPSSLRAARPQLDGSLPTVAPHTWARPRSLPQRIWDAPFRFNYAGWAPAAPGQADASCSFQPTGVREAWAQSRELGRYSADELLARQLNSGTFVNEHLQPSSYRFSGLTGLGQPLRIDFVGKVESITDDMRNIAGEHCSRRGEEATRRCADSSTQAACASLSRPACPLSAVAAAVGERMQNRHLDPEARSVLSPSGLRRLCSSEVYKSDAELYGYTCLDRPPNRQAKPKEEAALGQETEVTGQSERPATAEVESAMGPLPPRRRDSAFGGAFACFGRCAGTVARMSESEQLLLGHV